MSNVVHDMIQQHIDDRDNPHGVTKADVGLGNVENYAIATEDEAFAGNVKDRYITPRRLRDVFDGLLARKELIQKLGLYYNELKGEWYFNQMTFADWQGREKNWVDFGTL